MWTRPRWWYFPKNRAAGTLKTLVALVALAGLGGQGLGINTTAFRGGDDNMRGCHRDNTLLEAAVARATRKPGAPIVTVMTARFALALAARLASALAARSDRPEDVIGRLYYKDRQGSSQAPRV